MPRYFFHVHDGFSLRDDEGTELADLAIAKREAVRLASGLLSSGDHNFWTGSPWRMDVTDETGLILFTLDFHGTDGAAIKSARPDSPT
jgi:hypothetical protein